jgi:hypothetical protein
MPFAFPTDLVLCDVKRLALAFPKTPQVISIACLAFAFYLFPLPVQRHET